jgi:hypothetical protein
MLKNYSVILLVLAAVQGCPALHGANYASSVVDYQAGTLPTSVASYTNSAAALGEPSRVTPGQFGGPVDPFNPAYLNSQLVSVGANGSLTVQFSNPVQNNPANPYGLDFAVFSSSGFVISNGDYTGGGITDGSLFGNLNGPFRISVSADGQTYYALDPAKTPSIDGLFPTDGQGDFSEAVIPGLKGSDFAGLDLPGIRAKYAGAGGGAGFDLGWAIDTKGNPVQLDAIQYVRLEVLGGHAEIDGFSGLSAIPEPGSLVLFGLGLSVLVWQRRFKKAA